MNEDHNLVFKQFTRFVNKIPVKNFNYRNWQGSPTLPKRIDKLHGSIPYIPPQMALLTTYDREAVKTVFQEGVKKINRLIEFLDGECGFSPGELRDMSLNLEYSKRAFLLAGKNCDLVSIVSKEVRMNE